MVTEPKLISISRFGFNKYSAFMLYLNKHINIFIHKISRPKRGFVDSMGTKTAPWVLSVWFIAVFAYGTPSQSYGRALRVSVRDGPLRGLFRGRSVLVSASSERRGEGMGLMSPEDKASFMREGVGNGWEADVYVFALEDTLVPGEKSIEDFISMDKRYKISGQVIFDRIRGLLQRMKQPFYIVSKSSDSTAVQALSKVDTDLGKDFDDNYARLYGSCDDIEQKLEALKAIANRTASGITLSYVDSDAETVRRVLNTPELRSWKVYWADWGGGIGPSEYSSSSFDRKRGQILELGTFVELIEFGMILGYHDWGV
ncbi:hypothetical protein AAMO2058_000008400 [Amorphochlora amoebiformis]